MEATLKPCLIHWRDSEAKSGWHDRAEAETFIEGKPALIKTLGWLLEDGEDRVVVAQSVADANAYALLKIPRGMVEDMHVLSEPEAG